MKPLVRTSRSFVGLFALPLLGSALLAGGCLSLAPKYEQPAAPIEGAWPIPPTSEALPAEAVAAITTADGSPVAEVGWRDFLVDERLEQLVALALEGNRDLRLAALDVARQRARWQIQRADQVPSVDGGVSGLRQGVGKLNSGTGREETFSEYAAEVGITAYELDLFGRVRNQSQAALERYFATEEARRAVQISLIGEVARTYLTLIAEIELQKLAIETMHTQEEAYELTRHRHELGAVSGLEVAQALTTVQRARADAARFAGLVALDRNALALLIGGPVDPSLLPAGFAEGITGLQPLPAGMPSEVLLRRPDVLAAERDLRAANADIGAARAAFFPRISLTGSVGTSSSDLDNLFSSGTYGWTFLPRISIPIFQGGRLRANRDLAEVERDAAVARYERAIQVGFREVADALALTASLSAELEARRALVDAAKESYDLARVRYEAGRDSYFVNLDALRTWYEARQSLITVRLAEQSNRVSLYRALGGGWLERTGESEPTADAAPATAGE